MGSPSHTGIRDRFGRNSTSVSARTTRRLIGNIDRWLGDITGRPNDHDLLTVSKQVTALLRRLQHKLGIEENLQADFLKQGGDKWSI